MSEQTVEKEVKPEAKKRTPFSYNPKTDEQIRDLAVDIYKEKVFLDIYCQDPSMVTSVFMIMMFIDQETIAEMAAAGITVIYEYYAEALPRSINGYPIFMSARYMDRTDADKCFAIVKKLREAEKAI